MSQRATAIVSSALLGLLSACGGRAPDSHPSAATAESEPHPLLRSLPYGGSVPLAEGAPIRRGVTVNIEGRVAEGWILLAPRTGRRAFLLDNEGHQVHEWSARVPGDASWHHVELTPEGDLLVIVKDLFLLRLSWNSEILWQLAGRYHHDVAPTGDGGAWALRRREEAVSRQGQVIEILAEDLVKLDARGRERRVIPLLPVLASLVAEEDWRDATGWKERRAKTHPTPRDTASVALPPGSPADLFHVNSIELLPVGALGAREGLLLSPRELDRVVVLDVATGALTWIWGEGELEAQHHPSLTRSGTILVFDNGPTRQRSRVLELDPASGRIVWTYDGEPGDPLFSHSRGGAQRLSNGNTLITESDAGRALEVDGEGRIAWELFCPRLVDDGGRLARVAMYRVTRVTRDSHPGVASRLP